jgi:hypothetical protein
MNTLRVAQHATKNGVPAPERDLVRLELDARNRVGSEEGLS